MIILHEQIVHLRSPYYALRDLVPFLEFKKRKTKNNTPPWVFFTFLNCTNGTK